MNQYTSVGTAQRQHDLMGNLTASSDTGRQAFFDADNRLVQWTEGSKDVRYRYDVDGRRTMKEDVGSSSFARTLYFYDGWQEIEETNGSGTWTKRFLYGEGIDEVLRAEFNAGGTTLYYHQNSLGSVVAVTNAAGAVQESYRYDAYGKPTIYAADNGGVPGSVLTTTAVGNPFMFTGRRWDYEEGSGLYYLRNRFYDPAAGRFVSRDPLGLWGDASQMGNGQSYCSQNPVNHTDALGLGNDPNPVGGPVEDWDGTPSGGNNPPPAPAPPLGAPSASPGMGPMSSAQADEIAGLKSRLDTAADANPQLRQALDRLSDREATIRQMENVLDDWKGASVNEAWLAAQRAQLESLQNGRLRQLKELSEMSPEFEDYIRKLWRASGVDWDIFKRDNLDAAKLRKALEAAGRRLRTALEPMFDRLGKILDWFDRLDKMLPCVIPESLMPMTPEQEMEQWGGGRRSVAFIDPRALDLMGWLGTGGATVGVIG